MNANLKISLSWAFYDFANTIFSAVVLTAYFPLYLTEIAGANWFLGGATSGAMLLAGAVIPFIGALSDKTGKTKSYLILTTVTTVILMGSLTLTRTPFALIFVFIAACFFYHASLVFYNSLLPVAAQPENQGFVSGLGTGLGYLGVLCVLPIAHWVDQSIGRPYVFAAGAVLFLLASIPLFAAVPERKVSRPVSFHWQLWKTEWEELIRTLKTLPESPALLLFFCGNFFVVDALNSAIFWLAVYTREVFQPEQNKIIFLLMGINAGAFVGGLCMGYLTDKLGALKVLIISSALLAVTLALLASLTSYLVFVITTVTLGAFSIAGVWTSGRKALIDFTPPGKIGQYFGIYGLTTKVSVAGSLIFSIVADLAGFRQALWVMVFPASAGCTALFFSGLLFRRPSKA